MEEPTFALPHDLWAPTRPASPSDHAQAHAAHPHHLTHLPPSLSASATSSPASASPSSSAAAAVAASSSRVFPSAVLAQLEPKRSYSGFPSSLSAGQPQQQQQQQQQHQQQYAPVSMSNGMKSDPPPPSPHSPVARPPVHRSPSSTRALPDPIGSPSHRPLSRTAQPGSHLHNPQQHHPHQQQRVHSPPQAPPGASRSRSQSFASGFRPGTGVGGGGLPSFSFTSSTAGGGGGGGVFDDDGEEESAGSRARYDESKGNNSPFTRDLREILQDTATFHEPPRRPTIQHSASSRFDEFGFGRGSGASFSSSSTGAGGGAGSYGGMGINLFHAIESSGRFGLESTAGSYGGGGNGAGYGGQQQGSAGLNSGTGSRRHSVSIVPGRKEGGGAVPDFRISTGGSSSFGRNPWSNTGFARGGSGGGFSDEELATSLGNALSLNVDDGGQPSSTALGGGGYSHVPSSSSMLHQPSSLPAYAAPSPPRSFPSFMQPSASSSERTIGGHSLTPIASHPQQGSRGFLSTSPASSARGAASIERDYRTSPTPGGGQASSEGAGNRPGSKSRSASFADFTRPDHRRWATAAGAGTTTGEEDEDEFDPSPRGRERSFGLAPGGGGAGREASSPQGGRLETLGALPPPQPAGAARAGGERSASRDPIAASILRSPPGTAPAFAPSPAGLKVGGAGSDPTGGFAAFRPQQQQQPPPPAFGSSFAPTAPPFVPSGATSLPQSVQQPKLPAFGGGPWDSPFAPGRGGYGGPPPGAGGLGLALDSRFSSPLHHQQQQHHHQPSFAPPPPPAPPQQKQQQQQQQQQQQPYPNFYPQPPQYNLAHHQRQLALESPPPVAGPSLADLGKGLPLHAVPSSTPLYIVEFKAGRTDLFYSPDRALGLAKGDLVIVEADRGKDLGKVVNDSISIDEVRRFQERQTELALIAQQAGLGNQNAGAGAGGAGAGGGGGGGGGGGEGGPVGVANSVTVRGLTKEIMPKRIYSKAQALDAHLLVTKMQDEAKALVLCQQKVKQKNLPMEVVDAEFQWDRRKLTFYFIAERRIDFRELVRELFRYHKTRIWMACLGGISQPNEDGAPPAAAQ